MIKSFKQILNEAPFTDWKQGEAEFMRVEGQHAKLSKHYKMKPGPEHASISQYTSGSKDTNDYLWKQHKGEAYRERYNVTSHVEHVKKQIEHIDNHLNSQSAPHDLKVWSGTRFDPRDHMNSEKVVHHPAYISASIQKNTAKSFGYAGSGDSDKPHYHHHIMEISVPKGAKGAYVGHVSRNPQEREFILPRGTNLKYSHTTEHHYTEDDVSPPGTDNTKYKDYKYTDHVHHMKIV